MIGRSLRQENGFALVFALLALVVLTIAATSVVTYTTSNQHSSNATGNNFKASSYAEAGISAAYSKLTYANTTGTDPATASLLGCTGTQGPSNCATPTYICASFAGATCPSPYTATANTARVYGYFAGTSSQTYNGITVPKSTWLIVSTGYAPNEAGGLDAKTMMGEVTVTAAYATSGDVASVWNHIFLTAPLNPNTCQASFSGNNLNLTVPLYVIGNLCITGNNDYLKETGDPIDLQVGGKLVLGASDTVGDWSTSPATAITSGVVVGGCNSTGVTNATSPCDNGSFKYKVGKTDSFVSQDDPEITDSQVATDYSTFDPGPKHTCTSGTTPAPLADAAFDSNIGASEGATSPSVVLPDNSGSTTSGTAFELVPNFSYACISKNGTSVGYLIWNNGSTSLTVSGITVPAKTLAVNGSVFFDSNLTISQTATYQGTGIVMVAGTIKLVSNNMTLCAINTSCLFDHWQGNTGHNDMLTLATLIKNTTGAITFQGNSDTFQGSLWTRTSSSMIFTGNTDTVEGPLSIGSLDSSVQNATFKPLPVIQNMPLGAPVPPNTPAKISPVTVVG
jgi:Tfp pilus assembly protein PilX